jgi:hypothetical protein
MGFLSNRVFMILIVKKTGTNGICFIYPKIYTIGIKFTSTRKDKFLAKCFTILVKVRVVSFLLLES